MSEPRSRLDVGAFTAAEIQVMARFVDIPVDKVRRLTECSVLVGKLGRAVQDDGLDVERLRIALEACSYRDMRYTNLDRQVERIAEEYRRLSGSAPHQESRMSEGTDER